MKNIKKNLILGILLITPNIASAAEYIVCGNDRQIPLALANVFSIIMTIIRIIIPILIVIMGMLSYFKVVMAGNPDDDMKKSQKQLINSILAAVVIFFITSIINFAVGLAAGKDNSATQCLGCMIRPEKCTTIDSSEKICPGLIGQEYDEDCNVITDPHEKEKEEDINKDNYIDNNTTTPSTTPVTPPSTTPTNQVQTCCPQGGGTYNNGTCENITNQSAYDACINSGVVDVPEETNENTTVENTDEITKAYSNCCTTAGGTYNNGTCENIKTQGAYDACINTSVPKQDEAIKTQCCLKAGGKYDDGACKEYSVSSNEFNAYNACVGLGKDKEECCNNNTNGKYQNGTCRSVKFNKTAYKRCMTRS